VATITKEFAFSAAHALDGLPPEHQCSRVHGHNYKVRIELTGFVHQPVGFVYDYGALAPFREYLDDNLDHRWLGFGDLLLPLQERTEKAALDFNPTAENLARHLHAIACDLFPFKNESIRIGVSETDKTWAYYFR
jgi:6-pyruvoyltetrahydropterin/6-carboxytetrahydropterin synthase